MDHFLQDAPRLPDAWASDRTLRDALRFHLDDELFGAAEGQLAEMGRRAVAPETLALAARAEQEPPTHVPYAAWGRRIDDIRVSDAYLELGRMGIEAGVTALPYEDTIYGDKARLVWGALVALWGPSSALYSCPVAMTDAAARTLLEQGGVEELEIVGRLTSRDFDAAWSSGQWMTETTGGSDVGRTATVARRDGDAWRLYGTKWFTSATTSEMALTLARPEGMPEGSRGLAMFRVHRRLDDGSPNAIVVRRLKDKLGTRSLPTAELELEGALAFPVGDPLEGSGVRRISTMLNLTRIHNAIAAAAALARGLAWARAYARVREVFGAPLHQQPAHRATLTDLAVDHAAALALVLRCCELIGKVEKGTASDEETRTLRGLTPITKLATARWAVAGTAEAMEAIGGVAYCEDSTIPALVRNAHVLPIWEGTTNVLALDLLRAEARAGALEAVVADAARLAYSASTDPALAGLAAQVTQSLSVLSARVRAATDDRVALEASARSIALGLATTHACASLLAQATWATGRNLHTNAGSAAARLAARGLVPPEPPADLTLGMDEAEAPEPHLT